MNTDSSSTARDAILRAIPAVVRSDGTFTVDAVVDELRRRDTPYADSTIRTHVTSRTCSNAPRNHTVTYDDLVRVRPGEYQLIR